MKRDISKLLLLILVLFLTACSGNSEESTERTGKYDMYEDVVLEEIRAAGKLKTQYIITAEVQNGEGNDYVIKRIDSQEELNEYLEKYGELFELGTAHTGYYGDKSISFMEACECFNDAFWAENELLLVALSDGATNRHAVIGIEKQAEGQWILNVTQLNSIEQVGMSEYWNLLVELPRGTIPAEDEIFLRIKSEQVKEITCTTQEVSSISDEW